MTETLFNTIYSLLVKETSSQYEALAVPEMDKLHQSKKEYLTLCSW
ncbi:hypothetical protein [Vibrio anguillarum]|nr:hypothetical protein [Vibrio anguillarum]